MKQRHDTKLLLAIWYIQNLFIELKTVSANREVFTECVVIYFSGIYIGRSI